MSEFNYKWSFKKTKFKKNRGKVFSCFACGGGSTMGYKLAGYDVIGCNEIDYRMMEVYKANHNPKYSFLEPIQNFKERNDFPDDLFNLDILDGSPPCSSFSMSGNREKDWGKSKKFKEGQANQVLDTLFFDFIDLGEKLKPKVIIAENVKGLLLGNAKNYVREIYDSFDKAGYYVQHFLLNGSKMGLPQARERVFFIALRKDLANPFLNQVDFFNITPKLELNFNEKEIPFSEFTTGKMGKKITHPLIIEHFNNINAGESFGNYYRRIGNSETLFDYKKVDRNKPINTITANTSSGVFLDTHPNFLHDEDLILASSFPTDYNFLNQKVKYLVGMSVPPIMIAKISNEIFNQWLINLKN